MYNCCISMTKHTILCEQSDWQNIKITPLLPTWCHRWWIEWSINQWGCSQWNTSKFSLCFLSHQIPKVHLRTKGRSFPVHSIETHVQVDLPHKVLDPIPLFRNSNGQTGLDWVDAIINALTVLSSTGWYYKIKSWYCMVAYAILYQSGLSFKVICN